MEAKTLLDLPEDISTFHIQATESIQQRWPRTLKQGDMFALFDALGDCVAPALTPGGIFYNDTRYLSGMQLLIDGQRPLLLSSAVENDNVVLTVDLSNPDIYQGHAIVLPREILHVRRSKFLWQGTCYERIAVRNFDAHPQKCWLTINFAADFADLFEIRGLQRQSRGEKTCAVIGASKTIFRYAGLDKVERRTEICFDPPPRQLSKSQALYALDLKAGEQMALVMTVRCT
ncbi:MAG TPA: glycogen debranching N-terminal domain-containing protein, partial [Rhizomicrobium sp.]